MQAFVPDWVLAPLLHGSRHGHPEPSARTARHTMEAPTDGRRAIPDGVEFEQVSAIKAEFAPDGETRRGRSATLALARLATLMREGRRGRGGRPRRRRVRLHRGAGRRRAAVHELRGQADVYWTSGAWSASGSRYGLVELQPRRHVVPRDRPTSASDRRMLREAEPVARVVAEEGLDAIGAFRRLLQEGHAFRCQRGGVARQSSVSRTPPPSAPLATRPRTVSASSGLNIGGAG